MFGTKEVCRSLLFQFSFRKSCVCFLLLIGSSLFLSLGALDRKKSSSCSRKASQSICGSRNFAKGSCLQAEKGGVISAGYAHPGAPDSLHAQSGRWKTHCTLTAEEDLIIEFGRAHSCRRPPWNLIFKHITALFLTDAPRLNLGFLAANTLSFALTEIIGSSKGLSRLPKI